MNKLLSMQKVTDATGLSACSVYRMVKAKTFPQPLKLKGRTTAWVEAEVSEWIDRRIEAGKAEYAAEEGKREEMTAILLGTKHNAELRGRPLADGPA